MIKSIREVYGSTVEVTTRKVGQRFVSEVAPAGETPLDLMRHPAGAGEAEAHRNALDAWTNLPDL